MTIWILAAVLLRACLIANHPFYESRDVITDDRIAGVYADQQTGILTTLSRTTTRGHYRAVLQEGGSRSLYIVTLFKAGNRVFADITADRAPVMQTPGSETAPGTELLHRATAGRRHVVVRIGIRGDGSSVWLPLPDTIGTLWTREPALRRTTVYETVSVVTEPTRTLRRLLERHGQDGSVFSQEYWLAKKPR